MIITATTPEQAKAQIVAWLQSQATAEGVQARLAVKIKTKYQHNAKFDALNAAANFIEAIEIKHLPKDWKCPNCGEEML